MSRAVAKPVKIAAIGPLFGAWHSGQRTILFDTLSLSRHMTRTRIGTIFLPENPRRGWSMAQRRGWRIVPIDLVARP